MDALQAPSLEPLHDPSTTRQLAIPETTHLVLPPRLSSALAALFEALEYSHDLDSRPWEFALELSALRRLKLSNSDLRWLVFRGLVEHAVEVTLPGDAQRSFRRPPRLVFGKKTCFILSEEGATAYRRLNDVPEPLRGMGANRAPAAVQATATLVPVWDRDRRELRVGSTVVKRFKIPATAEETVLAVFEELKWPARIVDPWTPRGAQASASRLPQAIAARNMHQKRPLVRFVVDDEGQAVRWELCGDNGASA